MRSSILIAALMLLVGCAALRDDMRRAERAFDEARYEDVEVWLSSLEGDVPEMERDMRARYYYLRGVSAFRLGEKASARHYLALCREEAGQQALGLRTEWRNGLENMLNELDPENMPRPATTSGEEAPPPVQL